MNIFLPWNWKLEFWWFLRLPKPAKCDLLTSQFPNFKTFSISKQFLVTKIQIFSFRKENVRLFGVLKKNHYLLTKTYLYHQQFLQWSQNLMTNSLMIYMFCMCCKSKFFLPALQIKMQTNLRSQLVQNT